MELHLNRGPDLPTRAADVLAGLPAHLRDVQVRMHDGAKVEATSFAIGGMRTKNGSSYKCTTGWVVQQQSGSFPYGITDAGHCTSLDRIEHPGVGIHGAFLAGNHVGGWGDVGWIQVYSSTSLPAEFFATNTSIRDVTSVESSGGLSIGESVALYSRITGGGTRFTDSDVYDYPISGTLNGTNVANWVQMDKSNATFGDSGGGWSWNNKAYGNQSAIWDANGNGTYDYDLWSPGWYYLNALGVVIVTQ